MNQNIKDRIAKLLAMAKDSSSPNEAMIAMERARRLMNKYQIEEEDILGRDPDESQFEVVNLLKRQYRFMPQWMNTLAVAVGELNSVKGGLAQGNIMIAGYKEDVYLALMMFDRLYEECINQCHLDQIARGFGERYNAHVGDSFKKGFAFAVLMKVREIKEHQDTEEGSTELVLHKASAVEKRFGKTQTVQSKTDVRKMDREAFEAYMNGKSKGREVKLREEI